MLAWLQSFLTPIKVDCQAAAEMSCDEQAWLCHQQMDSYTLFQLVRQWLARSKLTKQMPELLHM